MKRACEWFLRSRFLDGMEQVFTHPLMVGAFIGVGLAVIFEVSGVTEWVLNLVLKSQS